jgi:uncharacterized protein YndB with AHSA1/START domain
MATISHKIQIDAPADRVFTALSTEDGLKGWYTSHIEGDVSEGKEATFRFTGRRPFRWRFAQITPTSHVRWECVEGPGAAAGTTVTYRLTDTGDGTIIECDHEGWPEGHEAFTTCNTLWGILMGQLKQYAETSTPAPAFQ